MSSKNSAALENAVVAGDPAAPVGSAANEACPTAAVGIIVTFSVHVLPPSASAGAPSIVSTCVLADEVTLELVAYSAALASASHEDGASARACAVRGARCACVVRAWCVLCVSAVTRQSGVTSTELPPWLEGCKT